MTDGPDDPTVAPPVDPWAGSKYRPIPAVAAGRSFALDTTSVTALADADPLTIPYAIEEVLPGLLSSLD